MLFILYGCKYFHKYFDNTFRRVAPEIMLEHKKNLT